VLGKRKVEENFSSFPPFRVGEKKSGGGFWRKRFRVGEKKSGGGFWRKRFRVGEKKSGGGFWERGKFW